MRTPPIFWEHTSDLSLCPWMVSSFLAFLSSFCSSSWCQLTFPKPYLSTGPANDPVAWILFFGLNSVPKTNLSFLQYSFLNFPFSFLCSMSWLSSMPKHLYAFLRSRSLMSFSNALPSYVLLWTLPCFKQISAHFSNPKFILMSLLIASSIFISFSKSSPYLPSSFMSSVYNKWFIFLSVPCTWYPQSALLME